MRQHNSSQADAADECRHGRGRCRREPARARRASSVKSSRDCSSARKLSAVQPSFRKRYFMRACAAVFAQALLIAKDLSYGARHANRLIGKNEGIEANGKMRFLGEASADAQRVADLAVVFGRREGDVVDLRMGAPGGAAGDGDFEFARQVVELRIAVSRREISAASGEASINSSAATPASGQPVTLRTTSPQAPLGESPMASSASTTSGSDSMVSQ